MQFIYTMSNENQEVPDCPICHRPLGNKKSTSKHHLIPKSKGGKHTQLATIHNICHQKIHTIFTEKELKLNFNTVEKLRAHEEMKKFILWVENKDPDFYQSNRTSNNLKDKRRWKGRNFK